MSNPQDKRFTPSRRPLLTRLRIWWWKWRYIERFLDGLNDRSATALQCAKDSAEASWEMALHWNNDDVTNALSESPVESADEELLEWSQG